MLSLEQKRQYFRIYQKEYRQRKRKEIIKLLGGKCVNPFSLNHGDMLNDDRCLEIDHVNNDGCKQRREWLGASHSSTGQYYNRILALIKNGSNDYQLLCANCNSIKRSLNKKGR